MKLTHTERNILVKAKLAEINDEVSKPGFHWQQAKSRIQSVLDLIEKIERDYEEEAEHRQHRMFADHERRVPVFAVGDTTSTDWKSQ